MGISNFFLLGVLVMHRDIERTLNITIFQELPKITKDKKKRKEKKKKKKGSLAFIDRDGCRWIWSGVLMRLILDVFWAVALWIL
jgi:hypothetical protein